MKIYTHKLTYAVLVGIHPRNVASRLSVGRHPLVAGTTLRANGFRQPDCRKEGRPSKSGSSRCSCPHFKECRRSSTSRMARPNWPKVSNASFFMQPYILNNGPVSAPILPTTIYACNLLPWVGKGDVQAIALRKWSLSPAYFVKSPIRHSSRRPQICSAIYGWQKRLQRRKDQLKEPTMTISVLFDQSLLASDCCS